MRTLSALLLLALSVSAWAQDYPSRPIRVVIPYSAGGSSDGPMRVIAQEMSRQLGQQMVVENKPGQGAMLGSAEVVKAPADGYTLLLASNPNAISASLYSRLTHDPVEDFEPITLLGQEQAVLLVHPSVPAKTVQEFIAYVKQRPGKVDFSSSGNGSAQHLFVALFASMAAIQLSHVPYKGSAQAVADLLGGQVSAAMPGLAAMRGHIREGRARALAVSGARRSPVVPDVPTLAESGFPGYEVYVWNGMLAPKGAPAAIIERLNREFATALRAPNVKAFMDNAAIEVITSTPAQFGAFFREEKARWAKIIREVGARID
ncbi:MAG: Bug family tripartite tricarboxylate transporter substrate binding protein [Betaproteobacteria bacterium]